MGALLTFTPQRNIMKTYTQSVKSAFRTKTARIPALLGLLSPTFFVDGFCKTYTPTTVKDYFKTVGQAISFKKHHISALLGALDSDFFDDEVRAQAKGAVNV